MDGRAGKITSEVVRSLSDHGRYSRVLTRNPILALQDEKIFREAGEYVTIGSSIPSLNQEEISAIESRAPPAQHRIRGLKEFSEMGVDTFVSMSPTYPTMTLDEMRSHLQRLSEIEPNVIFHEPINPRSGNFQMTISAALDAGQEKLHSDLSRLRSQENWLDYCLRQFTWVQYLGEQMELPVHLWPDKRQINMASPKVAEWLKKWKHRQSPENFAGRDLPDEKFPRLPQSLSKRYL
jgi:DNA repair photolyase